LKQKYTRKTYYLKAVNHVTLNPLTNRPDL